jgi:peptidoglycan/LPS O-acetylase OafA/YrhL
MTLSLPTAPVRLHHIDALRAFAMLLGIGLHVSLAYAGIPWIAVDQSKHEFFRWFFEAIHGYRMQLFFFVSGFFTMMLWRKRGLSQLLQQRFQRLVVPFLLGFFLIMPAMQWVTVWSVDNAPKPVAKTKAAKSPLIEAIRKRDRASVQQILANPIDLNEPDGEFGIPPLSWSALYGDVEITKLLLDAGANIHGKDRKGYRPLHSAAFMGRSEVFELLLTRGADAEAAGPLNDTARESAATDGGATFVLTQAIGMSFTELANLNNGRKACIKALDQYFEERGKSWLNPARVKLKEWRTSYREWLSSSIWNVKMNFTGPKVHLILSPQFGHLWFLWFLLWFVWLFALLVLLVWYLPLPHIPAFVTLSRFRLLWLIPLTLAPQLFMGVFFGASFGPDTATGVVPMLHMFIYYAVFFFAGVAYLDANDQHGSFGRWWWLWFPVSIGAFLQAKETQGDPIISGLWQVLYTWAMIFGHFGLFRLILSREWRVIRYFSDSAYWLYLMHLPLVLFAQAYIRDWPYPAWQKFLGVSASVTIFLLISYQLLVRHTYLGVILNGPRLPKERPKAEPAPTDSPACPSPQ